MPTTVSQRPRTSDGTSAVARIARAVAELRIEAGLSQKGLADRAGISVKAVNRIEAARLQRPPVEALVAIATALRTSVEQMLSDSADDALEHAALASTEANISALIILDDAANQLNLHAKAVYTLGGGEIDDAHELHAIAKELPVNPADKVVRIANRLQSNGFTAQLLAADMLDDGRRLVAHARAEIRPGYEAGEQWILGGRAA